MVKSLIALGLMLSLCVQAETLTLPAKATDISGKALEITAGKKGAVLVFLSARCPCSDSHVEVLRKLVAANPDFNFYAIHANGDEPIAESRKYFDAKKLPFPVIQDDHFKLADTFKANKTPHAFVLKTDGSVEYRGGVTDSHEAAKAHHQYLADALQALSKDLPAPENNTRTLGCVISRASL